MKTIFRKFFNLKGFSLEILLFAIPVLIFTIIWQIISVKSVIDPILFPPPSKIFESLILMIEKGTLIEDIGSSLWRALIGLLIGGTIGISTGLLMGIFNATEKALLPIIQIFKSFPPVAIIPLVIIWLGIDNTAKIFSISFAVFSLSG